MTKTMEQVKIGVIGLGYVGIEVAEKFSNHFSTTGLDIDHQKIADYQKQSKFEAINFSIDPKSLIDVNFYIVTVPTPVDDKNKPDFSHLIDASKVISDTLRQGDIIVYESTVYPGATEEICVPILEKHSNLKARTDFFVGYSPERVNIGDWEHTLDTTKKIIAAQTSDTLKQVREVYSQVIGSENIYCADSIEIAEAAKVFENTQRDLLIALINQVSVLFKQLSIDSHKVIEAASTKWNFNAVVPGLVGGHCISVDPYYLSHLAKEQKIDLTLVEEARRINENIPNYISQVIQRLSNEEKNILVLGCSYKRDTNDIRNSKSLILIEKLKAAGHRVRVCDYLLSPKNVKQKHKLEISSQIMCKEHYDVVVLAVAHKEYISLVEQKLDSILKKTGLLIDIEGAVDEEKVNKNDAFRYWKM